MTGKIKIILAVLSVISVLSLCACGKEEETVTTNIWESTPEVVEFSTEPETTYKSCEEPFSNAYFVKNEEIEEKSGTVTGAYINKDDNSVAIESYTDEDGYISFYVCKFKDGKANDITIETEMKKFTKNNNLLIDEDSDMLVLRYYIDKETIRQIIYDFDGEDFIAMRDKNFGYDDTESMEEAVTDYMEDAKNLVSFSDVAVTENVDSYIEKNLNTK